VLYATGYWPVALVGLAALTSPERFDSHGRGCSGDSEMADFTGGRLAVGQAARLALHLLRCNHCE